MWFLAAKPTGFMSEQNCICNWVVEVSLNAANELKASANSRKFTAASAALRTELVPDACAFATCIGRIDTLIACQQGSMDAFMNMAAFASLLECCFARMHETSCSLIELPRPLRLSCIKLAAASTHCELKAFRAMAGIHDATWL